ncbi:MAG: hypothetical protein WAX69_12160 [Victivallales bacterium]
MKILKRVASGILAVCLLSAGAVFAADKPDSGGQNKTIDVLMIGHFSPRAHEPWWPKFQAACAKEGIRISINEKGREQDYDQFTDEYLRQFQAVVFSGLPEWTSDTPVKEAEVKAFRERLDAYHRAGGGIMWVPLGFQHWSTYWNRAAGDRYDVKSLEEAVYDPGKTLDVNSALNQSYYKYIWTRNITEHPVTRDVKGLLLPCVGEWSWPGTVPMKFGKSWTVLVKGMDSTRTMGNAEPVGSGKNGFKPEVRGSYESAPEIVGVREGANGAGRMMVFPFHTTHTWKNFGHPAFNDAMMLNGYGGQPSDGLRLALNGLKWLADPATKAGLGGYKPAPVKKQEVDRTPHDWSKTRFQDGAWNVLGKAATANEYRGVFGARTAKGGGSGTVADYVTEAKRLGLAFVVFLEDLEKIDDAGYAITVKDCAAASDASFIAVPGYIFRDDTGVLRFCFDTAKLPLPENLTPERRVISPNNIVEQNGWANGFGIAGIGSMKLDMNYLFLFTCVAPYTYEADKLVDDGLAKYIGSEGVGHMYPPVSLTILRSPSELEKTLSKARVTTYRGKSVADFMPAVERKVEGPPIYLTNGPSIDRWGVIELNNYLRPGGQRFRLELKASSPAGLAEVSIIDAQTGKIYRRFKPDGAREFTINVDDSDKNSRRLIPIVTSTDGRSAVGSTIWIVQAANRITMMGDRLMGMHHSYKLWDETRTKLVTADGWLGGVHWMKNWYHGAGCYPSNPLGEELYIQGIDGGRLHSGAVDFFPAVVMDKGAEPKIAAYKFKESLAAFDWAVMDYIGNEQFTADKRKDSKGNWLKIPGWPPLPDPQIPMETADILARVWAVRARYHATVASNVHEFSFTFKKDSELKRLSLCNTRRSEYGSPLFLAIRDEAGTRAWMLDPVTDKDYPIKGVLPAGGYFYPANERGGAVGVVNLGPEPVSYEFGNPHARIFIDAKGRSVKAGDTINARLLVLHRPWKDQRNDAWLQSYLSDFGVGVEKPGYPFSVEQGKIRSTNYSMELDSANGGAMVTIGKYKLPHNLAVRVSNVPSNAIAGRFDLDKKQLMMLPVFEETVTTSVNTTLGDTKLYVGELFHCDNKDVLLSCVQDGADKLLLELHNPTEKVMTAKLTAAAGFAPLAGLDKAIDIPPFSSVKLELPVAAGLLTDKPYEGD